MLNALWQPAFSQSHKVLNLESATITSQSEWIAIKEGPQRWTAFGSESEVLVASSYCLKPDSQEKGYEIIEETIPSFLTKAATDREYKISLPLTKHKIQGGVAYTITSQQVRDDQESKFFFQVAFGSANAVTYVHIDGRGDSSTAYARYRHMIDNWSESSACSNYRKSR
jgi:hypothetical protein